MSFSRYALAAVIALWCCNVDALTLWSWHTGPATYPGQNQPGDIVARKLTDPGVYYDTGDGSPFVPVPGLKPEGVDVKRSSTPQPLFIKIPGPRASVRTSPEPTFYGYKVEGARIGKPESYRFAVSLYGGEVAADKRRLVRWGTFASGSGGTQARPDKSEIEVAIDKLTDDLFRLRPLKPLPAGEFVLLPDSAVGEVSIGLVIDGRYRPTTAVYGFGVEQK